MQVELSGSCCLNLSHDADLLAARGEAAKARIFRAFYRAILTRPGGLPQPDELWHACGAGTMSLSHR